MLRIYVKNPAVPESVVVADTVKYGYLYNWYAATDARLICADGWEVPEKSDLDTLIVSAGTYLQANYHLKETGTTYWTGNIGADNSTNFNARGIGIRQSAGFNQINAKGDLLTISVFSITSYYYMQIANTGGVANTNYAALKHEGRGVRLIKTTTTLSDGQTGTYTGNDGKVYRTICIGTQEWLADNLCETKFRNGDYIPGFDAGVYTPFSNAAWAGLTTAALCAYNDDLNNV